MSRRTTRPSRVGGSFPGEARKAASSTFPEDARRAVSKGTSPSTRDAAPSWTGASDDRERVLDWIDSWVRDDALVRLISAFGVVDRLPRSTEALLEHLDAFSAANWDFRGGRERNLARAPHFTPGQLGAIESAADALGLDSSTAPSRPEYDAVLMTGGMVRAGIVKPRYVRELVDAGLRTRGVVFVGGFRPFGGDEHELARRLGVAGDDEFDAMSGGLVAAFGLNIAADRREVVAENPNASWREDSWPVSAVAAGATLTVLAAPSKHPESRRANTEDTLRFWAARVGGAVRSVLVVTTPVYVPYQGSIAVRVLGLEFGMAVETVAVSASASDLGEDTQPFLPRHKLQEIRSAIRGIRDLHASTRGLTSALRQHPRVE